jgi:hypothetical protein
MQKEMFNIQIPSHPNQNNYHQENKQQHINTGKDTGTKETYYIVDGTIN